MANDPISPIDQSRPCSREQRGAGKLSASIRFPSNTSAAGMTTTAPPVANAAHVSAPVPTDTISCVGADQRDHGQREHERGTANKNCLAGGLSSRAAASAESRR